MTNGVSIIAIILSGIALVLLGLALSFYPTDPIAKRVVPDISVSADRSPWYDPSAIAQWLLADCDQAGLSAHECLEEITARTGAAVEDGTDE